MLPGTWPVWGVSKIADVFATHHSQKSPANAILRTLSRPYSMRKSPQSQSGTFLARERNLCVRERYLHVASLFNVVCSISMLHIFRFLQILDFRRKIHENCFSGYDRAHNGSVYFWATIFDPNRQKTFGRIFGIPGPLSSLAIQC